MRTTLRIATTLGFLGAMPVVSGCTFDEEILIHNLQGTVRVPVEAATQSVAIGDDVQDITDPRFIGPVYLGLYPSVLPEGTVASYPHPEIGPQFAEGVQGDTYPYGGTTVGDIRFTCFEFLRCKMVTGRFPSYDDLVSWYADVLQTPIVDSDGKEVEYGILIQQTCFDLLEVTSDHEIGLITGDRNGDGQADDLDLDFQLSADGQYYEAEFNIWQQNWYWDVDEQRETGCTPGKDCTGFTLWGFMDAPDGATNLYSTCNPNAGYPETTYNNNFNGGKAYSDVLNKPTSYLTRGDWVAGEGFVWNDMYEQPVLDLDFEVK